MYHLRNVELHLADGVPGVTRLGLILLHVAKWLPSPKQA